MGTPSNETLDAVCALITGDEDASFARVTAPEQRVAIINMALAAERNELLDDIDARLSHVSRWFELSRLYEP